MKLTCALVSQFSGEDIRKIQHLDLKGKQINAIDDIGACIELSRVDLSENQLSSLQGIAHNKSIAWLKVANNQLTSMTDLSRLVKLNVLNLGGNKISRIQGLQEARELKALVLNNNELTMIENLENTLDLNTLVVSHNKIFDITNFRHLKKLKKLSVAHNRVHDIPDLSSCPELKELRINDNKIQKIPSVFALNSSLEVLDLGNNFFRDLGDIEPLKYLLKLENLNLKGNPITRMDGYKETMKKMIPSLKILDGERFDQAFLHRKMKRKMLTKKREAREKGSKTSADESEEPKKERKEPKQPKEAFEKKRKAESSSNYGTEEATTLPPPKRTRLEKPQIHDASPQEHQPPPRSKRDFNDARKGPKQIEEAPVVEKKSPRPDKAISKPKAEQPGELGASTKSPERNVGGDKPSKGPRVTQTEERGVASLEPKKSGQMKTPEAAQKPLAKSQKDLQETRVDVPRHLQLLTESHPQRNRSGVVTVVDSKPKAKSAAPPKKTEDIFKAASSSSFGEGVKGWD